MSPTHDVSSASSSTTSIDGTNPVVITIEPAAQPPEDSHRPVVGGWLKLFCFTLIVSTPLGTIYTLISEYQELSPYFARHATVLYVFALDALLGGSLALFSFYAGVQLGRLKPHAVHTAKRLLVALLAYTVLIFAFSLLVDRSVEGTDAASHDLVRGMFYFLLWMLYLRKSKRVRATYPETDVDAAHRPFLPEGWAPSIIVGAALVTFATLGLGTALQNEAGHLSADVSGVASTNTQSSSSSEWHEYISTKDDFSVSLPGTPERTEQRDTVNGYAVFARTYSVTTADDVGYIVEATEIPKELDVQSGVLAVLDGAIKTMATNVDGQITDRSITRVEGFPAADVTITSTEAVVRARVVVTDDRVFVLLQAVKDASEGSGSYSRFRESFVIAPR